MPDDDSATSNRDNSVAVFNIQGEKLQTVTFHDIHARHAIIVR